MITPGSFDLETSREIVGDEVSREIEEAARRDADKETKIGENKYFNPPDFLVKTYWDSCEKEFIFRVYCSQYQKRYERRIRKGELK